MCVYFQIIARFDPNFVTFLSARFGCHRTLLWRKTFSESYASAHCTCTLHTSTLFVDAIVCFFNGPMHQFVSHCTLSSLFFFFFVVVSKECCIRKVKKKKSALEAHRCHLYHKNVRAYGATSCKCLNQRLLRDYVTPVWCLRTQFVLAKSTKMFLVLCFRFHS